MAHGATDRKENLNLEQETWEASAEAGYYPTYTTKRYSGYYKENPPGQCYFRYQLLNVV